MFSGSQFSIPIFLVLSLALCSCDRSGNQSVESIDKAPPFSSLEKEHLKEARPEKVANGVKPNAEEQFSTSEAPQADYEPPYPNRENLFLAPRRSAKHQKTTGSNEQSVELLGFANVIGPRVILSINGNVVPMAEGGQEAGIEVISIQPPAVVLQRDRERWQATLEN